MQKETIIYFEQLGFGWVLDNMILKEIKLNGLKEDCVADKSLMQIIENMLIESPKI